MHAHLYSVQLSYIDVITVGVVVLVHALWYCVIDFCCRYCLVFVPFTGVDNHRRCITLGAGLLTKEDVESYIWLLDQFKTAMGKSPLCLVTDQDPSLKIAVGGVFPDSHHRFCM